MMPPSSRPLPVTPVRSIVPDPALHRNEHRSAHISFTRPPSSQASTCSNLYSDENTLPTELQPLSPSQTPDEAVNSTHAAKRRDSTLRRKLSVRVEEGLHDFVTRVEHGLYLDETGRVQRQAAWDRFRGKGMRKIGWLESMQSTALSSVLNVLLVFIPLSWAAYFTNKKTDALNPKVVFSLCWLAIVPLEKLFDFGGKQMAFYTGKHVGDLIIITLNNAVEAMLAIVLLLKCQLRILQATITGVVLLHLLLVPGISFLIHGTRVYEQALNPHYTQLNNSLLAVGVLSLLVPTAFFASLDGSASTGDSTAATIRITDFLDMSHGIAIVLLAVYSASRIFLHKPPGDSDMFVPTPIEMKGEQDFERKEPKVNPWFCILFLIVTIGIMAVTAELLVNSIGFVKDEDRITDEWFGLFLLPTVSFSADGFIAVVYFLRALLLMKPRPPQTLAEDRAFEMSIQFTLFWTPVFVILAWCMGRPLLFVFDTYEVALLLGACFLVNYVTADMKTNWAEGLIMVSFYAIIALCTWFYTGQGAHKEMLTSTCQPYELGAS